MSRVRPGRLGLSASQIFQSSGPVLTPGEGLLAPAVRKSRPSLAYRGGFLLGSVLRRIMDLFQRR